METLFLDIETIPASEEKREVLRVLYEKKLAKRAQKNGEENTVFEEKDFEQFLLDTTFDGAFGRIICIGYAHNDELVSAFSGDERMMLEDFWRLARGVQRFVGHNIFDFDMRFIYQRSIVLGVCPTQDLSFARYRSTPMYDTMKEWVKWGSGSVGLETLALALDIPSPKDEGIDGSQVFSFYRDGRLPEIVEYCKRDVETTRAVYERMLFMHHE
jgi:predicted PolB exonuclease-like 3'-5' exonuclease